MANVPIAMLVISIPMLVTISILLALVMYHVCTNLCMCATRTTVTLSPSASELSDSQSTHYISNKSNNTNTISAAKVQIQPFFRHSTLAATSIYFAVCVLVTIERIMSATPIYSFTISIIFTFLVQPLYYIGGMLWLLIFIGRLHYTFYNTAFQHSKCAMRSLFFFWSLMPFSVICMFIAYGVTDSSSLNVIMIIFAILFFLVNIILSCTVCYLYLKKLYHIAHVDKTKIDIDLLNVMTRFTLLYVISFSFTAMMWIGVFIITIATFPSDDPEIMRAINVLECIDSFANSVGLWLNFRFANYWYSKLCKYGDNILKRRIVGVTNDESAIRKCNSESRITPVSSPASDAEPEIQTVTTV